MEVLSSSFPAAGAAPADGSVPWSFEDSNEWLEIRWESATYGQSGPQDRPLSLTKFYLLVQNMVAINQECCSG